MASWQSMESLLREDSDDRIETSASLLAGAQPNPPQWERFRKGLKLGGYPSVAIYERSGIFSLNDTAFRALGSPKALFLLWDEEHRTVGLQAGDIEDADSYKARPANGAWQISAKSFCNTYGLRGPRICRRYTAHLRGDVLCFKLEAT